MYHCSNAAGESSSCVALLRRAETAHLEGSKDLASCRCALQASIKKSCEGARLVLNLLNGVILTSGLLSTLVGLVQTKLLQDSTCQQQSSSIGCCIVRKTSLHVQMSCFQYCTSADDADADEDY